MITVSELVGKSDCAAELHDLKLWEMDAEEVSPANMQGFFYRAKIRTSREIARNCANFIAEAINEANQARHVRNDRLVNFSISEPPYLSSELRVSLEQMSVSARRCVYFSLLMGWSIDDAVSLTWKEVGMMIDQGHMFHQDAAMDVLDMQPRHFRSPLVFWDDKNGRPVKLSNLRYEVETAFDCSFEMLLDKFQSMVLVDPGVHAQELRAVWGNGNG